MPPRTGHLDALTLCGAAEVLTYLLFPYCRQVDLPLFCALPKLFHVTLEGPGCSSEEDANGPAVTVAISGEATHTRRPFTGRKPKRDGFSKLLVGPQRLEIYIVLSGWSSPRSCK